jgi:IS5 family transposase
VAADLVPTVLLRMPILEQYTDLSDREVHEQVGYNLPYRAFVGLGMNDPLPDHTTLVRFRARVGEAGIRAVFEVLTQQRAAAGLIGPDRRVLGRAHLWAKVTPQSDTASTRRTPDPFSVRSPETDRAGVVYVEYHSACRPPVAVWMPS